MTSTIYFINFSYVKITPKNLLDTDEYNDEFFKIIDDIDNKVKKKSFKILSKNKIKVRKGLLKKQATDLYESYIINRKHKLPYVTAKIAISKNNLNYS